MSESRIERLVRHRDYLMQVAWERKVRIEQLEEALRPFSNLAEIYDPESNGHFSDDYRVLINLGMARKARAALSPSEPPEEEAR